MQLADIVAESQSGQGLSNLARQFNLTDDQVRAAIDQLGPVVMAGVRRETQSADGLSGLLAALAGGDHARYMNGQDDGMIDDGNAILGHIFGSKEVSRGVAAHAAASTGIGAGILKKMLPVIAAMVMGYLAKRMGGGASGGGLGGVLGQIFGGGTANAGTASTSSGGGLGDILGQVLGGRPPGNGGLGDILGQVLGGGKASGGSPAAGGSLTDILGGLFGADAPPNVRQKATAEASARLNSMLGGDTSVGSDGDGLLRSVEEALRRR
jgi:hypothetical protein